MTDETIVQRAAQRLEAAFERVDGMTLGWLGTLRGALDQFALARGTQASAAVAYYAMFSLFPMLMVLVVSLSYLVDAATARSLVFTLTARFLPNNMGIESLVLDTFASIYSQRGSVGLIGLVALLWSASGAFTTLTFNIDLAWTEERRPNPFKARLIGLLLILLLFAALLLALFLSTVSGVLAALPTLYGFLGIDPEIGQMRTLQVVSILVTVVAYSGLYRWIPNRTVPWRAAVVPAILAALASQVVNAGYSWYLGSGFSRYEILYGPLTTIIVLMFWFFLTVLIILVGAHLGAGIARRMDGTHGASRL
ncbi:MAG: YihY/virulence factor BrkB family protein [Caldilineae bacterium]|nr:YihY/virulence factor BrkB family protein [Anaerolineae bacterium]MCB0206392.1 YihY/virulence factor BrkB family protein [Anaerolineae bacterium]MCB9152517.1 YihY/virulence factor BrkB family protein [Caldilineae bacterium]